MRQTSASKVYKLGYSAKDFSIIDLGLGLTDPIGPYVTVGAPGDTPVLDQGRIVFTAATSSAIAKGMLSPATIILPAKDVTNVKASIIWSSPTGASGKVGWLMAFQHVLIGNEVVGSIPTSFVRSSAPTEVDYIDATQPGYDDYWTFPKAQWAIGYGTADGTAKKTPLYQLKYDSPSTLKLDDAYAIKNLSEEIDGHYALVQIYIYRTQGTQILLAMLGSSFLMDGLYDGDGDGALDSDTSAQSANFLGLLLELV
jgi:hypothetical protein